MGKQRRSGDWMVARTQHKAEQIALRNLNAQGFETYLPLLRCQSVRGVRRVEPLFERYIFIKQTPQWRSINGTRGVHALFTYGETPALARAWEVEAIRASENELGYIDPYSRRDFKRGEEVSPRSGAFSGQIGKFAEMTSIERCLVLFEVLGKTVSVEMRVSALA